MSFVIRVKYNQQKNHMTRVDDLVAGLSFVKIDPLIEFEKRCVDILEKYHRHTKNKGTLCDLNLARQATQVFDFAFRKSTTHQRSRQ